MVQSLILSCIACDYLGIQGSAVPSQRALSSSGLTATACWNRLFGEIFEALQILKSGYLNGHNHAPEQAKSHFINYINEFIDLEISNDIQDLE